MMNRTGQIRRKDVTAQCFPLYSIMLALGRTEIDYLSLDVEGPELEILSTIPYSKLKINVISVEFRFSDNLNIDEKASLGKLRRIREFFAGLGMYKEAGILPENKHLTEKDKRESNGLDVIFARKDI